MRVRDRSGFSLVELLAALAISGLMLSIATIAGVRWVESARVHRATSKLVNNLVLAREKAISKYQQWQITFNYASGSVAESYMLAHCQVPPGQRLGDPCTGGWTYEDSIPVDDGIGVTVTDTATGAPVSVITFDRSGYFLNPTVDITICEVGGDPTARTCRDQDNPKVRIHDFVGSIELCPTGQCPTH